MIEADGLTKRFGDTTAVDGVTFRVDEGEVFGFLGPNGAGKTTTVRMLCCLISKSAGEARIGGFDVGKESDALRIRGMIGFVPDNVGLYEVLSAYRNLDIYGRLYGVPETTRKENIKKLLNMLDLWEKRDEAAGTFSKGMKQKLAVVRGLVHDPRVIFMDEPTANLDPEASKTVRDFILELKKEKRTIFLNTHNLGEAQRVCDRIGILNTKLKATGTPKDLEGIVGKRRVVVELESVSDAMVSAVEGAVTSGRVSVEGVRVAVEVGEPEGQVPDVVGALVKAGGRVRSAGVVGSTLEDTYLELVKGNGS